MQDFEPMRFHCGRGHQVQHDEFKREEFVPLWRTGSHHQNRAAGEGGRGPRRVQTASPACYTTSQTRTEHLLENTTRWFLPLTSHSLVLACFLSLLCIYIYLGLFNRQISKSKDRIIGKKYGTGARTQAGLEPASPIWAPQLLHWLKIGPIYLAFFLSSLFNLSSRVYFICIAVFDFSVVF